MKIANRFVMFLAGLFLAVAAVLKVYEVLNVAIPPLDFSQNPFTWLDSYPFYLLQIPLEFALGAWMLSGLFRKAAWLFGTLAYFAFIFITLAKGILGYESCGCFGQVHINPWVTLFSVDIPFFLLLAIFYPRGEKLLPPPWPNTWHAILTAVPIIGFMAVICPIIVTFRPDFKEPDQVPVAVSDQTQAKLAALQAQLKQGVDKSVDIEVLKPDIQEHESDPLKALEQLFMGKMQILPTDDPMIIDLLLADRIVQTINLKDPKNLFLSWRYVDKNVLAYYPDGQNRIKIPLVTTVPAQAVVVEKETASEPSRDLETTDSQTEEVVENADKTPETEQLQVNLWDWMPYVDVADELKEGLVLVMMYHHDCPVCREMVPEYERYSREMAASGDMMFQIAYLAIPPHEQGGPVPTDTVNIHGSLSEEQDWAIMSPYVVALLDGEKIMQWEQGTAPQPDAFVEAVFAGLQ